MRVLCRACLPGNGDAVDTRPSCSAVVALKNTAHSVLDTSEMPLVDVDDVPA